MPKAIDVEAVLGTLTPLRGRGPETVEADEGEAFATLASFDKGAVFVGSFDGESPWERHRGGDELVHILKGETSLTILTDNGEHLLSLKAGMLTVVPKACWHRFSSPCGVTVLTVTPQPTEHSTADDPR
ncbi:cupin domain-containing protein [Sneathiella sp.]|uniref:cupin domain-containing protein n=1 Tax=Sneathiella sp. TaxID=1964365 RepID=UPI0035665A61